MDTSIVSEINRLRQMSVAQLRLEWERLYGEPTRSRNRTFLWRRLVWRIQEIEYGGLSEPMKQRIFEVAPTTFIRSQLPDGFRPDQAVAPTSQGTTTRRDPRLPSPGSTLVRKYKGDDVRVLVLDGGFEWAGQRFDTLSQVAHAVTSSHWSGPLFFGLRERKR